MERPTESNDTAQEPAVHFYRTEQMTVEWRPSLCIHSGICARGLPAVFSPRRRPWIVLGDTDVDVVDAQVKRCPSGALRFIRHGRRDDAAPDGP